MNKTPTMRPKNHPSEPANPSHDVTTVHPTIESPNLHATIESVNAEKNTRATRATLDKKTSDIAAMFDTVAERYDLMNGILSLGQHIYWRKQAVAAVDAHPGQKVLDVAAGTGVSSEPFADAGVDVIAADLSEGMLDVGRRRRPDMTFVQADVTALPFEDGTFDAVTMSYGLRNVADYPKALSEIYRVLKPGGIWRLATDWEEYALVMREVLEAHPDFENVNPGAGATEEDPLGGWAPRWEGRTLTSFERKAQEAGRRAHDLTYRRK